MDENKDEKKIYRPILGDDEHLVGSKDNPDRVRGLSRDANNKNPNIPEWEEVSLEELQRDTAITPQNEERQVELTPAQQELAEAIGNALATVIIDAGEFVYHEIVKPMWYNHAWPWIKAKAKESREKRREKKKAKKALKSETGEIVAESSDTEILDPKYEDVSLQIDQVFEKLKIDMDAEEATEHMMRLIYHMLGLVNEIRIISNSRIRNKCESETEYLEAVAESERFLSEKVASCLDRLLDDPSIELDLTTSRELFALTGGGVRINGDYAPVQAKQIEERLREIPTSTDND